MKYFIDFEANAYKASPEIISVGIIREDGKTFYSLVKPKAGKLKDFTTNYTSITNEELELALSSDKVFSSLDWILLDDNPIFYFWGNGDKQFINSTLKRLKDEKAKEILSTILNSYHDYQRELQLKFKRKQAIGLLKVYKKIISDKKIQTHNSLEDAEMVYEIWKYLENNNSNELIEKLSIYFKDTITPPKGEYIEMLKDGGAC